MEEQDPYDRVQVGDCEENENDAAPTSSKSSSLFQVVDADIN